MIRIVTHLAFLLIAAAPFARAQHAYLLAWYPLDTTADDSTCHFAPMILNNTPFQAGGGIFSNGIYQHSGDPNGCDASTPDLPLGIFKGFTLSVKFKVDSMPGPEHGGSRNIITGGMSYRWLGIGLWHDSTIGIYYNNHNGERSLRKCSVGIWHEATLMYDSALGFASLSLDGAYACSKVFVLAHGYENDQSFSTTDYSVSSVFQGYMKDLRIYGDSLAFVSVSHPRAAMSDYPMLSQNYPNPFHGSTAMDFTLPSSSPVSLAIYNTLGQCVATPLNDFLSAGKHSITWNADGLPPGVYTYRLTAGDKTEAKTLVLRR